MALLSDAVWLLNLLILLNFYANNPDIPILSDIVLENILCSGNKYESILLYSQPT